MRAFDTAIRAYAARGGLCSLALLLLLVPRRAPAVEPRPESWFFRIFANRCTYLSLSAFRILLYGVVLGELTDLALHANYTIDPGLSPTGLLAVALVASLACLLGAFTRVSAIVAWIALKLLQPHLLEWYEVDW